MPSDSTSKRAAAARQALSGQGIDDAPAAQRFLAVQAQHHALLQRLDGYAAQLKASGRTELLPRVALLRQTAMNQFEAFKAEMRIALR